MSSCRNAESKTFDSPDFCSAALINAPSRGGAASDILLLRLPLSSLTSEENKRGRDCGRPREGS